MTLSKNSSISSIILRNFLWKDEEEATSGVRLPFLDVPFRLFAGENLAPEPSVGAVNHDIATGGCHEDRPVAGSGVADSPAKPARLVP